MVHDDWTSEEDSIILRGQKSGLSWSEIAKSLPGRVPDQIRNRFTNDIDPTLNHSPLSQSEREKVLTLQSKYGNKWTQIAKEMPGRSSNMVKNYRFGSKHSRQRERCITAIGYNP